ncbi:hypothetical protein BOX15_Mlig022597g1 [Macrostomum lignano]|uniref:Uncharacterized protein n=1 Tax=Macrostomum lignano TaxID=282301 RepID=A0A267F6Q3_9PLAT|nr:hypothetical protein BOX15_Mlig022597g1 [Macrostomum lignano]
MLHSAESYSGTPQRGRPLWHSGSARVGAARHSSASSRLQFQQLDNRNDPGVSSALNSVRQTRSHLDSMSNDINRFLTEQRLSSVSYSPDSLADQQRSAYAARSRSISPSYYGGDHQSATRHRLGAPLSSGYDNSASNGGRTPTRVYRYPTDPNLAMSKPQNDAPPTPPPAATFQEIELIQLKRENAELNNKVKSQVARLSSLMPVARQLETQLALREAQVTQLTDALSRREHENRQLLSANAQLNKALKSVERVQDDHTISSQTEQTASPSDEHRVEKDQKAMTDNENQLEHNETTHSSNTDLVKRLIPMAPSTVRSFDYVKQQLDESQAILKRQQELLDEMDEDRKASAPGARQRHLPESAARRRGVAAFRSRSLTPDSGQRGAALSSAGGSEIGDSMQQLIADGRQKDATIRSLSGQVGSLLAERDERSANQAHVRDGLLDLEADLDRLADLPEAANLQHELQPLMEKVRRLTRRAAIGERTDVHSRQRLGDTTASFSDDGLHEIPIRTADQWQPQQQPQGMPMGAPVEQQPQQQPQGMPMGAPVEQQPQQQPQGMPMGAPVEQQPQQQPQGMPMGAPAEQQPQQQRNQSHMPMSFSMDDSSSNDAAESTEYLKDSDVYYDAVDGKTVEGTNQKKPSKKMRRSKPSAKSSMLDKKRDGQLSDEQSSHPIFDAPARNDTHSEHTLTRPIVSNSLNDELSTDSTASWTSLDKSKLEKSAASVTEDDAQEKIKPTKENLGSRVNQEKSDLIDNRTVAQPSSAPKPDRDSFDGLPNATSLQSGEEPHQDRDGPEEQHQLPMRMRIPMSLSNTADGTYPDFADNSGKDLESVMTKKESSLMSAAPETYEGKYRLEPTDGIDSRTGTALDKDVRSKEHVGEEQKPRSQRLRKPESPLQISGVTDQIRLDSLSGSEKQSTSESIKTESSKKPRKKSGRRRKKNKKSKSTRQSTSDGSQDWHSGSTDDDSGSKDVKYGKERKEASFEQSSQAKSSGSDKSDEASVKKPSAKRSTKRDNRQKASAKASKSSSDEVHSDLDSEKAKIKSGYDGKFSKAPHAEAKADAIEATQAPSHGSVDFDSQHGIQSLEPAQTQSDSRKYTMRELPVQSDNDDKDPKKLPGVSGSSMANQFTDESQSKDTMSSPNSSEGHIDSDSPKKLRKIVSDKSISHSSAVDIVEAKDPAEEPRSQLFNNSQPDLPRLSVERPVDPAKHEQPFDLRDTNSKEDPSGERFFEEHQQQADSSEPKSHPPMSGQLDQNECDKSASSKQGAGPSDFDSGGPNKQDPQSRLAENNPRAANENRRYPSVDKSESLSSSSEGNSETSQPDELRDNFGTQQSDRRQSQTSENEPGDNSYDNQQPHSTKGTLKDPHPNSPSYTKPDGNSVDQIGERSAMRSSENHPVDPLDEKSGKGLSDSHSVHSKYENAGMKPSDSQEEDSTDGISNARSIKTHHPVVPTDNRSEIRPPDRDIADSTEGKSDMGPSDKRLTDLTDKKSDMRLSDRDPEESTDERSGPRPSIGHLAKQTEKPSGIQKSDNHPGDLTDEKLDIRPSDRHPADSAGEESREGPSDGNLANQADKKSDRHPVDPTDKRSDVRQSDTYPVGSIDERARLEPSGSLLTDPTYERSKMGLTDTHPMELTIEKSDMRPSDSQSVYQRNERSRIGLTDTDPVDSTDENSDMGLSDRQPTVPIESRVQQPDRNSHDSSVERSDMKQFDSHPIDSTAERFGLRLSDNRPEDATDKKSEMKQFDRRSADLTEEKSELRPSLTHPVDQIDEKYGITPSDNQLANQTDGKSGMQQSDRHSKDSVDETSDMRRFDSHVAHPSYIRSDTRPSDTHPADSTGERSDLSPSESHSGNPPDNGFGMGPSKSHPADLTDEQADIKPSVRHPVDRTDVGSDLKPLDSRLVGAKNDASDNSNKYSANSTDGKSDMEPSDRFAAGLADEKSQMSPSSYSHLVDQHKTNLETLPSHDRQFDAIESMSERLPSDNLQPETTEDNPVILPSDISQTDPRISTIPPPESRQANAAQKRLQTPPLDRSHTDVSECSSGILPSDGYKPDGTNSMSRRAHLDGHQFDAIDGTSEVPPSYVQQSDAAESTLGIPPLDGHHPATTRENSEMLYLGGSELAATESAPSNHAISDDEDHPTATGIKSRTSPSGGREHDAAEESSGKFSSDGHSPNLIETRSVMPLTDGPQPESNENSSKMLLSDGCQREAAESMSGTPLSDGHQSATVDSTSEVSPVHGRQPDTTGNTSEFRKPHKTESTSRMLPFAGYRPDERNSISKKPPSDDLQPETAKDRSKKELSDSHQSDLTEGDSRILPSDGRQLDATEIGSRTLCSGQPDTAERTLETLSTDDNRQDATESRSQMSSSAGRLPEASKFNSEMPRSDGNKHRAVESKSEMPCSGVGQPIKIDSTSEVPPLDGHQPDATESMSGKTPLDGHNPDTTEDNSGKFPLGIRPDATASQLVVPEITESIFKVVPSENSQRDINVIESGSGLLPLDGNQTQATESSLGMPSSDGRQPDESEKGSVMLPSDNRQSETTERASRMLPSDGRQPNYATESSLGMSSSEGNQPDATDRTSLMPLVENYQPEATERISRMLPSDGGKPDVTDDGAEWVPIDNRKLCDATESRSGMLPSERSKLDATDSLSGVPLAEQTNKNPKLQSSDSDLNSREDESSKKRSSESHSRDRVDSKARELQSKSQSQILDQNESRPSESDSRDSTDTDAQMDAPDSSKPRPTKVLHNRQISDNHQLGSAARGPRLLPSQSHQPDVSEIRDHQFNPTESTSLSRTIPSQSPCDSNDEKYGSNASENYHLESTEAKPKSQNLDSHSSDSSEMSESDISHGPKATSAKDMRGSRVSGDCKPDPKKDKSGMLSSDGPQSDPTKSGSPDLDNRKFKPAEEHTEISSSKTPKDFKDKSANSDASDDRNSDLVALKSRRRSLDSQPSDVTNKEPEKVDVSDHRRLTPSEDLSDSQPGMLPLDKHSNDSTNDGPDLRDSSSYQQEQAIDERRKRPLKFRDSQNSATEESESDAADAYKLGPTVSKSRNQNLGSYSSDSDSSKRVPGSDASDSNEVISANDRPKSPKSDNSQLRIKLDRSGRPPSDHYSYESLDEKSRSDASDSRQRGLTKDDPGSKPLEGHRSLVVKSRQLDSSPDKPSDTGNSKKLSAGSHASDNDQIGLRSETHPSSRHKQSSESEIRLSENPETESKHSDREHGSHLTDNGEGSESLQSDKQRFSSSKAEDLLRLTPEKKSILDQEGSSLKDQTTAKKEKHHSTSRSDAVRVSSVKGELASLQGEKSKDATETSDKDTDSNKSEAHEGSSDSSARKTKRKLKSDRNTSKKKHDVERPEQTGQGSIDSAENLDLVKKQSEDQNIAYDSSSDDISQKSTTEAERDNKDGRASRNKSRRKQTDSRAAPLKQFETQGHENTSRDVSEIGTDESVSEGLVPKSGEVRLPSALESSPAADGAINNRQVKGEYYEDTTKPQDDSKGNSCESSYKWNEEATRSGSKGSKASSSKRKEASSHNLSLAEASKDSKTSNQPIHDTDKSKHREPHDNDIVQKEGAIVYDEQPISTQSVSGSHADHSNHTTSASLDVEKRKAATSERRDDTPWRSDEGVPPGDKDVEKSSDKNGQESMEEVTKVQMTRLRILIQTIQLKPKMVKLIRQMLIEKTSALTEALSRQKTCQRIKLIQWTTSLRNSLYAVIRLIQQTKIKNRLLKTLEEWIQKAKILICYLSTQADIHLIEQTVTPNSSLPIAIHQIQPTTGKEARSQTLVSRVRQETKMTEQR